MPITNWDELRELMKGKKNAPLIVGLASSQEKVAQEKVAKDKISSIPLPKDYNWHWLKEQAKKPRIGSPTMDGYLAMITQQDRKQRKKQVDTDKFPYAFFRCVENCCPLCQSLDGISINRRSWAQSLFIPPIHDFCLCYVVYSDSPLNSPFVFPSAESVEQWYGDRFLERVLRGEYEPSGERMKVGIERMKRAIEDGYLGWDEQLRDIVVLFQPPFEGIPERLPLGLFPTVDEITLRARQGWKWKEWKEWLVQPYVPPYTVIASCPSLLQLFWQFLKSLLNRS